MARLGGVLLILGGAGLVGYEEPRLRRLFGEEYERYRRRVPRWAWLRR